MVEYPRCASWNVGGWVKVISSMSSHVRAAKLWRILRYLTRNHDLIALQEVRLAHKHIPLFTSRLPNFHCFLNPKTTRSAGTLMLLRKDAFKGQLTHSTLMEGHIHSVSWTPVKI